MTSAAPSAAAWGEERGRVGRYALVSVLGEGGFGTVWLASQEEPVRRLVALKLLRRDPSSSVVMARFRAERQALARMDHPNVASVLDAGVAEDGRPWFAMPYIDGPPITRHCDDERLGVRERVALFAEVCDGVQHAHQKGVIHRDIKPGNVLVSLGSGRATPKVIDFGVAKALEPGDGEGARTAEGQRLGTPQYMAPEQWLHGASAADARSDVYALGVLLSELLVGGPPAALPRTPLEVPSVSRPSSWIASVATEDPERAARNAAARQATPEALGAQCRGDLDAIVARATAQDPSDRYASAAALAEDIRRWLDGLPVSARASRPVERMLRLVRRHPRTAAVAGATLLALLVLAASWISASTTAARERAAANMATAQSQRTFLLAKDMISDLVAQQRTSRDPAAAVATFARIERLIDRVADDDPLVAARLAAVVADGYADQWDRRAAFDLVDRSIRRVVAIDPAGETDAFRELARPWHRLMLRGDRVGACSLGPLVFADVAGTPALADPGTQDLLRHTLDSTIPWPVNGTVAEMEDRLRVASVYASFIEDPEQAQLELALHRVAVLRRCEGHPWAIAESDAAIAFVQRRLPPHDEQRLSAELRHALTDAIANGSTPHVVQELMLLAARCEHALGPRSPLTVNAYWNLCMNAATLGDIEGSYDAFARFLWPEMSRQVHADGLRRWYLAYFAPVAFLACDYETAYAAGMQVLSDDLWIHGSPQHDGVAANAARAAAAALAHWGDEAGARSIEADYGVTRIPPLTP
jgi:serine/threonine protein kinase